MPHRINLLHNISDKAFDKKASDNYQLSIQLSLDGFSFCVLDHSQLKFISLQAFDFQYINSAGQFNAAIEQLITTNELLSLPYNKIIALYETNKSTLIPSAFYDRENHSNALEINHRIELGETTASDHLPILEAYNVWVLPQIIENTVKKHFPDAPLHLHTSILIEQLLTLTKNHNNHEVFVHVRKTWFDILVISNGRLLFSNSFRYQTKEDFIYFLIYVLEQLELNPETVQLTFLGLILKRSQLYDITVKYIRNVSFIQKPADFKFSYVFDEIPNHFYFNLFNHFRCEL
ncbi:MAG TPA: DUF3822 family protein [Bacteroidales bacterium]|nr:DUF3822 family protein [Bacteroidales bacterium]HRW96700.1 DUF3822 family protein [Bacteroidales bacterium]